MGFSNGIRAILFDFDGTLRHSLPSGGEVFSDYLIGLGLPITNEDRRRAAIWEHYYFASSPEIQADSEKYSDEEDFWFHFAHRRMVALGCTPDLVLEVGPKVSEHMRENYSPDSVIPDEIYTVIPALREAGYTLGVVSNRDKPYQDEIEGYGMGDFFRFSLAAGEVKSWKPDSGVFEHALKMAGATPEQAVYIGDNYFADIVGAHRAGLQPVLYDPKRLFHEPGCPVIINFNELSKVVQSN